jgi:hypothetical protein
MLGTSLYSMLVSTRTDIDIGANRWGMKKKNRSRKGMKRYKGKSNQ